MANYKENLKNINTFIFDYDGVLTDGSVITANDGEAYRTSNVKDGYALQLARKKGYKVAIISGARSESMIHRLKALQITDVFLGVEKKQLVFRKYLTENNLNHQQVLYMGDEGGITCDITPDGATSVVLCSLTQVEILADHPLAAEIQAYQQARIRKLAARGAGPRVFPITPR